MRVVTGIYGSPRAGGNTDLLLDTALAAASRQGSDVDRIYVRQLSISGCISCGECADTGVCPIDDSMQSVYEMLTKADAIIVSAPVYFYGLPSQLKAVIDRCQALWEKSRLSAVSASRRGFFMSAGATGGKRLFAGSKLVVRYFFSACGVSYADELLVSRVDAKGEILHHPTACIEARRLGGSAGKQEE